MMSYFQNFSAHWQAPLGAGPFGVVGVVIFALLLLWSLVWKALAVWRAARQGRRWWFVALLVVNTFGILEILFLFVFSKRTRAPDAGVPATDPGL
jgi:hypothetical protein